MNFTETGRLILKFHKTIRKNISSGILAESSIPQPVTVGYFCSQFFKDGRRTETDKQIKPPRAWRFKSPMWGFQYRWDRGSVYKIFLKKKKIHHKMLSKNLFIHLLFKVKPVSQRAKRQHLPPPTWKLKRISMPRPMSHPTGRKESMFLPDACMSARASRNQTPALWLCSHSLTSQISESSGGSFLSWRRRAKTCSEWTLLSVRRLTSFISIRGNIRWSFGLFIMM